MRKSRRKPFIAIDAGVILLAILFFVLTGDGLGEGKEGSTNSVIEKKKSSVSDKIHGFFFLAVCICGSRCGKCGI